MIIQYNSEKVLRVLYVDNVSKNLFAVNIKEEKWPQLYTLETIFKDLELNLSNIVEDIYIKNVDEEAVSEISREKRDFAWKIVSFVLTKLEGIQPYISRYRSPIINEASKMYGISYNTIKSYMIRFWKFGSIKNSLIGMFENCGGRNKHKSVGNMKRGRPSLGNKKGINIDENIKKIFIAGLNKYYYNSRQNNLKTTYELIIRDNFVQEYISQGREQIPIINNDLIPTYGQFYYWFKKLNDTKNEVIKRKGERIYHQNYRSIIGSSTQEAELGPATLWQIDSTIFDIYLVSSLNRNNIVGRPVFYQVMDVYSRQIMGFSLTLESFNSYNGAMLALTNSMTSKVEFCKRYGVEIDDEDWPYAIPQIILADRGELMNDSIQTAIENLNVSVQNSPPYRADYKGIIEQAFHQMNLKIKPFADGVVTNGINIKERGQSEYRTTSNLTLQELTSIVLKSIIFYNTSHVLSEEVSKEMIFEENIEKVPIKIWNYGIENNKGILRKLPKDIVETMLYPSDVGQVTSKGVSFRKMLYASEYTLKQGWFSKARTKGSWSIKLSYNPLDLTNIFYIEDDKKTIHKLTLVEHLKKYSNRSEYEISEYLRQGKEINDFARERELSNKIKLFNEIEAITNQAREEYKEGRDDSLSKTKRLKGIDENNKKERELSRKELVAKGSYEEIIEANSGDTNHSEIKQLGEKVSGDLDLFINIQEEYWGDIYE
ncbi:hypothetical protein HMPREF1982_00373 [Clostridiales bacterium oral taxon 876 str. F0540]|nr:hypothetical protein HMPREF1982_00373 [Clostridiales bacterium oral taxon 876 str. F0540]